MFLWLTITAYTALSASSSALTTTVDHIYFISISMTVMGESLKIMCIIYLNVIIFSLFHKIVFFTCAFRKYITYESKSISMTHSKWKVIMVNIVVLVLPLGMIFFRLVYAINVSLNIVYKVRIRFCALSKLCVTQECPEGLFWPL